MTNSIKKCVSCKGTGLVNKTPTNVGYTCPVCKGIGVPLYDEEFDNAKTFLGDDLLIDLDDDED